MRVEAEARPQAIRWVAKQRHEARAACAVQRAHQRGQSDAAAHVVQRRRVRRLRGDVAAAGVVWPSHAPLLLCGVAQRLRPQTDVLVVSSPSGLVGQFRHTYGTVVPYKNVQVLGGASSATLWWEVITCEGRKCVRQRHSYLP